MSTEKHKIGPFTTQQAADIVGVSTARIRQLARQNLIEHERFGNQLVITDVGIQQAKNRNKKSGRPRLSDTTAKGDKRAA